MLHIGDHDLRGKLDRARNRLAPMQVGRHGQLQEWLDDWAPRGIVASPIGTLKDVSEDPQAWENDYLVKAYCSEVDREVDVRGFPIGMSETPGCLESLGPELGQDTEILLMEMLEMEWDRIEALKADGIIP